MAYKDKDKLRALAEAVRTVNSPDVMPERTREALERGPARPPLTKERQAAGVVYISKAGKSTVCS